MKKNPAPVPNSATAIVLIESTNGVEMNTKTKPEKLKRPSIAMIRLFLVPSSTIARGDASSASRGSCLSDGNLDNFQRASEPDQDIVQGCSKHEHDFDALFLAQRNYVQSRSLIPTSRKHSGEQYQRPSQPRE